MTINRREFLKKTVWAAAAPLILPASALGRNGSVAPGNKITVGFIGVGWMGTTNLQNFLNRDEVQVVAVCDVDGKHVSEAQQLVNGHYGNSDCRACVDFREITQRPDIDAVVISTPDHWHTIQAVDACVHGKDVYVEKPLTLTIDEGRVLVDAARRYGRVVQTGTQQRSMSQFRYASELVRNGRLGKVHTVHVEIPPNSRECEPTWTPQAVPPHLHYDLWLGPSEWAPYHPQRCHYSFRFNFDYSGGQVTNWGAHFIDIAQWALGMDNSGPVEISGKGEFPVSGLFNTATKVHYECLYENGTRLICTTITEEGRNPNIRFIGTEGSVYVTRDVIVSEPESLIREVIGPEEVRLEQSSDHAQNFLDCMRTRRRPIADVEVGHRTVSVCHLGNIAMLLDRKIQWDPAREVFVNDPDAERLKSRPRRAPWRV